MITTPIFLIVFSRILSLDIEIDSGFHFLNDIAAGKKVTLSIKAYKMPILKQTHILITGLLGQNRVLEMQKL